MQVCGCVTGRCCEVYEFDSGKEDKGCSANLFSTGQADLTSYYDIWQAVTAVFSKCARYGYTGSVRGLGRCRAIGVERRVWTD